MAVHVISGTLAAQVLSIEAEEENCECAKHS
jgi:hypothetical protein